MPEPTRRDCEEPTTPSSSTTNVTRLANVTSCRDWIVPSESSCSPSIFAQKPTHAGDSAAADYHAAVNVSANQLGPNWFFNGVPIFSEEGRHWASTRTGQAITWADFCIPMMDSSPFSALHPSFSQELPEIPDQNATREVLNGYFRSSFRLTFPVLDQVLFDTTMETAYKPVGRIVSSPTQVAARACVLSALSIASRLNAPRQTRFPMDAGECAAKAHFLLMHLIGNISLETLQTGLIFVSRIPFSLFPTTLEISTELIK